MAVDTLRKRHSALNFGRTRSIPLPSGTVDQFARQTNLGLYGGILADEPVILIIPAIKRNTTITQAVSDTITVSQSVSLNSYINEVP